MGFVKRSVASTNTTPRKKAESQLAQSSYTKAEDTNVQESVAGEKYGGGGEWTERLARFGVRGSRVTLLD